eukprot:gene13808-8203_t
MGFSIDDRVIVTCTFESDNKESNTLQIGMIGTIEDSEVDQDGDHAVEIEVVGQKTGVVVKVEPQGRAAQAPEGETIQEMPRPFKGHVANWNGKFGFITRPGEADMFFHKTAWKGKGEPDKGIPVSFIIQNGRTAGSKQAGNVRPDSAGDQTQVSVEDYVPLKHPKQKKTKAEPTEMEQLASFFVSYQNAKKKAQSGKPY